MLLRIPNLLSAADLDAVQALLDGARFADGRASAGADAARVKRNLELDDAARARQLDDIVMARLTAHPEYLAAALPARVARPRYVRYQTDMGYGDHIDDPVMGPAGGRYRCDIAITVFLNAPDDYDGGELVVGAFAPETAARAPQTVKLPAGDAVLYPADSVHRVEPVTRGARVAAVTWVQSLVAEPARRAILYRLAQLRTRLADGNTELAEQAGWIYAALARMWASP